MCDFWFNRLMGWGSWNIYIVEGSEANQFLHFCSLTWSLSFGIPLNRARWPSRFGLVRVTLWHICRYRCWFVLTVKSYYLVSDTLFVMFLSLLDIHGWLLNPKKTYSWICVQLLRIFAISPTMLTKIRFGSKRVSLCLSLSKFLSPSLSFPLFFYLFPRDHPPLQNGRIGESVT